MAAATAPAAIRGDRQPRPSAHTAALPAASTIASLPTAWWASQSPAAAPTGACRRGLAAARATPFRPASTARPARGPPISSPTCLHQSLDVDRPLRRRRPSDRRLQRAELRRAARRRLSLRDAYGGVTPYAAIQAQSFHTPGYSETDAIANGFALAFGSRDATDTRSELGARFDRALAVYPNAVLALRGRSRGRTIGSAIRLQPVFQSLPGASFIVNGAIPAQNSALASAGAELRLANGITLLAKFDGEFASHSSTYAGTGTIRYAGNAGRRICAFMSTRPAYLTHPERGPLGCGGTGFSGFGPRVGMTCLGCLLGSKGGG